MNEAMEVAQTLLNRQVALHAEGKEGSKDVMSILSMFCLPAGLGGKRKLSLFSLIVKANLSEKPESRLGDDEILPQLT